MVKLPPPSYPIPEYDIPPPPQREGTEAWAMQQMAAFSASDQAAINNLLTAGLQPYASLWRTRVGYARACNESKWDAHQARLVWSILEILVGKQERDEIPF